MKLRATFPLGLIALSALALAAAQGVVLKRTPKVGDKATYKLTGNYEAQGTDVAVNGTTTEEVTKVEDGSYTTDSTQKATLTVGGGDQEMPETKRTTKRKLDGSFVEAMMNGEAAPPAIARLTHASLLLLPTTPVDTNGTWSTEGKKDDKGGVPGYKVDYKFVGEEKIGAWDTYKITSEGHETDGDLPTSWKSTYWIAKTDGSLVRSVTDLKDVDYGGGAPPLSGKIELMRQP